MKRVLPRSLRAQLLVLVLATLALAQGLSMWLFVDERGQAVQAALAQEAAGRAANVALLLDQAPANLQTSILRAAGSPLVRFSLDSSPAVDHANGTGGDAVAAEIRTLMSADPSRDIRVDLHVSKGGMMPMPGMSPKMVRMHKTMGKTTVTAMELRISIATPSGGWLNVSTRFHRPPYQWAWSETATFAVSAVLVALSLWFTLGRLTGPLRRLADAADRLGRGEDIAEIAATGPEEMRRLTDAFNAMQTRLKRFVDDRAMLLAALGHDLRSPLTALRVRAEMVEDDETRDRLVATIVEMQEMVAATLSFARGMAISEPAKPVDLADFVTGLITEIAETGGAVTLEPGSAAVQVRLRANAMRRAQRNLIENALRYGDRARITVKTDANTAQIIIEDDGPGIPDADQERVFDPFVRLETSRSRETGGTGLGLSIARTIIRAHGGDVVLANCASGGLRVVVTLPTLGAAF